MRVGQLVRDKDPTGVSGTGIVAEFCEFSDLTVALRWFGEHSSTVVWASIEDALAIHGHDGHTKIAWT